MEEFILNYQQSISHVSWNSIKLKPVHSNSRTSDPKVWLRQPCCTTSSPIECLLCLANVRAKQYKLGPERLTRLGNSNVPRLPVNYLSFFIIIMLTFFVSCIPISFIVKSFWLPLEYQHIYQILSPDLHIKKVSGPLWVIKKN